MKEITPKNNNGSILIQFRHDGKKYSFNPIRGGKFDDPHDIGRAKAIAQQIAIDIENGFFDTTLAKYKPRSLATTQQLLANTQRELAQIKQGSACIKDLWNKYCEYKKPSVKQSTFDVDYVRRIGGTLKKLPVTDIRDAVKIRDYLIANHPPTQVKKILTQLNACCDWAKESRLIEFNPFEGMASKIKLPKKSEDEDINPFTAEERDRIIEAFKVNRYYKHYANLVEFLFSVGCRPGEALALTWGDVNRDEICFSKGFVNGKLQKGLKTNGKRCIPMNPKLKSFINEIKPETASKDDLIFPSPDGLYIDWHNFANRAWKKVLESLPDIEYRNPYQTRHTFITLALKNKVHITDVAKHCGNSPEIILKRYSGVTRDFVMPEF